MKRKAAAVEEPETSESEVESIDSDDDERLIEAFQKGELKPGLNVKVADTTRTYSNNIPGLQAKLKESTLELEWVERLDLTTNVDVIVEGILSGKEATQPQYKVETPGDRIVDDLQRETLFYRQAQSAVIEGLARLKAMAIPTKRPDDYFAQMAKSDDHMLKVKQRVLSQQVSQEKAQKVKKLRELKKYGKKVQIEVGLQRAKEKRDMLSKVKQFREGKLASLDFLEENEGKKKNMLQITKQKTKDKNEMKLMNAPKGKGKVKRQEKDKKFGFGGKKSGGKKNNLKKADGPPPSAGRKHGPPKGKGVRLGNKNKRGGNKPKGGGRNKR
nr:EOG090X0D84 [Chydorus sphaericus]